MDCDVAWLREQLATVADFPEPGVRFVDLAQLWANPDALRCVVELIADCYVGRGLDAVAGIDGRGFIFAAPVACRLGCGFIPIRKAGKLPSPAVERSFELEYGTATLQVQHDGLAPGSRVLVVDDVLATGGTAAAAVALLGDLGVAVEGFAAAVQIEGLGGAQRLGDVEVTVALGAV